MDMVSSLSVCVKLILGVVEFVICKMGAWPLENRFIILILLSAKKRVFSACTVFTTIVKGTVSCRNHSSVIGLSYRVKLTFWSSQRTTTYFGRIAYKITFFDIFMSRKGIKAIRELMLESFLNSIFIVNAKSDTCFCRSRSNWNSLSLAHQAFWLSALTITHHHSEISFFLAIFLSLFIFFYNSLRSRWFSKVNTSKVWLDRILLVLIYFVRIFGVKYVPGSFLAAEMLVYIVFCQLTNTFISLWNIWTENK